ncbi:hypothetical protein DYU11_14040 [Fibrisoma montanum]|uniref:Uncharacterized protein n=1 Tax=Fibrisoma montanum TaxID=2305895 RepID=A0A418M7P3_9BACT|nr:hypothetical protein [Fibrisoma montanum]RIV22158.1 hypothetical protein DYU11_14040 [Fibrisoma montanum]
MNIIEKTVEPKNGAIDLHFDVPAEWNGKQIKLRIIFEEDTGGLVDKDTKPDLTRFRGKWAHLPLEERLEMQKQLDDMRNEWERPI